MQTKPRSPNEIRSAIEQTRAELVRSVDNLRGEVVRVTDWRRQLAAHREQIVTASAVTGFVVGSVLVFRALRRR